MDAENNLRVQYIVVDMSNVYSSVNTENCQAIFSSFQEATANGYVFSFPTGYKTRNQLAKQCLTPVDKGLWYCKKSEWGTVPRHILVNGTPYEPLYKIYATFRKVKTRPLTQLKQSFFNLFVEDPTRFMLMGFNPLHNERLTPNKLYTAVCPNSYQVNKQSVVLFPTYKHFQVVFYPNAPHCLKVSGLYMTTPDGLYVFGHIAGGTCDSGNRPSSMPLPLSLETRVFYGDREITDIADLMSVCNNSFTTTCSIIYRIKDNKAIQHKGLLHTPKNDESGTFKNQWWLKLTGYFRGEKTMNSNQAIMGSGRILWASGVGQEEAIALTLQYFQDIPKLQTAKTLSQIEMDIRRFYKGIWQDNGRQSDPQGSKEKLEKSVETWHSKGLYFEDKSTWDLTYGYARVSPVIFTEHQKHNICTYLAPLLTKRDLGGRDRNDVAIQLMGAVIQLVQGKRGQGISYNYWAKYIKGTCGIYCDNRNKLSKLKQAWLDLGFIRVVSKGATGHSTIYATRHFECVKQQAEGVKRETNSPPTYTEVVSSLPQAVKQRVEIEEMDAEEQDAICNELLAILT
jgi:hypothetical protein